MTRLQRDDRSVYRNGSEEERSHAPRRLGCGRGIPQQIFRPVCTHQESGSESILDVLPAQLRGWVLQTGGIKGMTDAIKVILGFCVFLGLCAIPELLADWMLNHAPDWIWIPIFLAIPAGLVVWLWREYKATVKQESTEREEGDDHAHL